MLPTVRPLYDRPTALPMTERGNAIWIEYENDQFRQSYNFWRHPLYLRIHFLSKTVWQLSFWILYSKDFVSWMSSTKAKMIHYHYQNDMILYYFFFPHEDTHSSFGYPQPGLFIHPEIYWIIIFFYQQLSQ